MDRVWREHIKRVMNVFRIDDAKPDWMDHRDASRRCMGHTYIDAEKPRECEGQNGMEITVRSTPSSNGKQQNGLKYCSNKHLGQLFDDLPKSSKHRLIVQSRFGPTNTEVTTTLDPKDLDITTTEDARHQDHREDSKPRMVHTYDEADDARECDWKIEESVSAV